MGQIICEAYSDPLQSGTNGGGNLKFLTAPTGIGASPTVRMTIDWLGNVGIATATPNHKLEVQGDTYLVGNFYSGKTGSIGTSNMIEAKVAGTSNGDALIKIGDVNDYWGGSGSYSTMEHY